MVETRYAALYQQLLRWEAGGLLDVWHTETRTVGGGSGRKVYCEAQVVSAARLVDAGGMAARLSELVGFSVTRAGVLAAARQEKISSRRCGGTVLFDPEVVVEELRPEGVRDDTRYRPNHKPGETIPRPCSNPRCSRGPNGSRATFDVGFYELRNHASHFCSAECKYDAAAVWNRGGGRKGSREPHTRPVATDGRAAYWADPSRSRVHRERLVASAKQVATSRVRSAERMDKMVAGRMRAHEQARREKRQRIATALTDEPGQSNRAVARELQIDPRIVGIVRAELERDQVIPERRWAGRKQSSYPSYPHRAEYTDDMKARIRHRAHSRASTSSQRSAAARRLEEQVVALWPTEATQEDIANACHVTPQRVGQIARKLALPPRRRGRPRKN